MYSRVLALAVSVIATIAITGCEKHYPNDPTQEHPEAWQPHLKVSEVPLEKLVVNKSVYVPVYAHIFFEDRRRMVELAETVSFRNSDARASVVVRSVNSYSSDGVRLRSYLAQPIILGPLASVDFVVFKGDVSGGTGGKFIINWGATGPISPPIIEAIMVSCGPSRNLSFVSRGVTLDYIIPDDNTRVDQNDLPAPRKRKKF